ncbi:MAG: hypothetical protein V7K90_11230 [Nostoc sp.]|uniref:hypothetical protein n=1 Tax=Nostoc sp. TaxID=1180 RepID=UPI002FFB6E2C
MRKKQGRRAEEAAIALNYGPPSAQPYEQIILRLQAQGIAADGDRAMIRLRFRSDFGLATRCVWTFVSHLLARYCATGKLDHHIQELIACYKHKCQLQVEVKRSRVALIP